MNTQEAANGRMESKYEVYTSFGRVLKTLDTPEQALRFVEAYEQATGFSAWFRVKKRTKQFGLY